MTDKTTYCGSHTDAGRLPSDIETLLRALTGERDHDYQGGCPEPGSPNSRDPDCPVCRAMVRVAAARCDTECRSVAQEPHGWAIHAGNGTASYLARDSGHTAETLAESLARWNDGSEVEFRATPLYTHPAPATEQESVALDLAPLRSIVSELQDFYDSHAPKPTRILRQAAALENWIDAARVMEENSNG